jgi:hypothetical protein
MTSPLNKTLKGPVRVLIRTQLVDLENYHPCVDSADTKLIEQIRGQLFDDSDNAEVRHLITRISDKRKSDQVDIVFDYDVPISDSQPKVMAFKANVEGSLLRILPFQNPQIKSIVNRTIEAHQGINSENALCFPSRVDLRAETLKKRRAPAASDVSKRAFNETKMFKC